MLRNGKIASAPGGIVIRGFALCVFFFFGCHEFFLSSISSNPSRRTTSPTDKVFSASTTVKRRSNCPSGISQILSSPSWQQSGTGRVPAYNQFIAVQFDFHILGCDTRQRGHDPKAGFRLDDVDRRLPTANFGLGERDNVSATAICKKFL